MKNVRLIARLDIKAPNLIKGVNLEGVRVVGDPQVFAKKYYQEGIDEILYMDVVATLYGRNSLSTLVAKTAESIYVPMTVGGGIQSLEEADSMLRSGADKIAINTAVIKNPELITQIAKRFGAQCMVLSVEAKRKSTNSWEAYTDNGRNKTGIEVIDWIKEAETLGVGEILMTSVDHEGLCAGFDVELIQACTKAVNVPIIASGGLGAAQHLLEVIKIGGADAVAIAHALHYKKLTIAALKEFLADHQIKVRRTADEFSSCN